MEPMQTTVLDILLRLSVAGLIGGLIGYERRAHHKVIGGGRYGDDRHRQHHLHASRKASYRD